MAGVRFEDVDLLGALSRIVDVYKRQGWMILMFWAIWIMW